MRTVEATEAAKIERDQEQDLEAKRRSPISIDIARTEASIKREDTQTRGTEVTVQIADQKIKRKSLKKKKRRLLIQ